MSDKPIDRKFEKIENGSCGHPPTWAREVLKLYE